MSFAYDMGFGGSDGEGSSSMTNEKPIVAKDYWFGKKYFECVIAQILLQQTEVYEKAADIDVLKLEAIAQSFPYRAFLQKLKMRALDTFSIDSTDSTHRVYQQALGCIGTLVRQGSHEERSTLIMILREESMQQISDLKGAAISSSSQRGGEEEPQLQRRASDVNLSATSLGQYSMALQAYSSQHGFVPAYTVRTLPTTPPTFEATVSSESFSFKSIARTKKHARHQAAQQACEFLQIQI